MGDFPGDQFGLECFFQVDEDLPHAEHAHGQGDEIDPLLEHVESPGEADRSGDGVEPYRAEEQAHDHHDQPLDHRAFAQHGGHEEPHESQGKIFGGAEFQGEFGQGRSYEGQADHTDGSGDEGPDGGYAQRRAGPAFAGHLVAVDTGDHRSRFAGDIDQDGGGRPAVHGAVEDSGHHDDGSDRRADFETDGEEKGDGGCRAEAGKDPDDGPQKDADESKGQVRQGESNRKATPQPLEYSQNFIHDEALSSTPENRG